VSWRDLVRDEDRMPETAQIGAANRTGPDAQYILVAKRRYSGAPVDISVHARLSHSEPTECISRHAGNDFKPDHATNPLEVQRQSAMKMAKQAFVTPDARSSPAASRRARRSAISGRTGHRRFTVVGISTKARALATPFC
jgi:hypothetical protein